VDVPAGGVFYREGTAPRSVLVIDGLVRVFMTSREARQVTVRYARRGDVLGVAAVVGGAPPVSVQAVSDCRLLSLNATTLATIARSDSGIGWAFAEELTRRLYDVLYELSGNVFGTVSQRVIRHLLDLSEPEPANAPLVARVSQQELADAVGSVREVVARVLGELRRLHLVETSAAGIVIRDPPALFARTFFG
jgi:CRP/FNR family cyclic AMP-dependent transcriptional regulator